jgi:hypothetical protein
MTPYPERSRDVYGVRSQQNTWRKSTYCQGGECIEVSRRDGEILMRSSRSPADVIRLTNAEWSAFIAGASAGEFSDLG